MKRFRRALMPLDLPLLIRGHQVQVQQIKQAALSVGSNLLGAREAAVSRPQFFLRPHTGRGEKTIYRSRVKSA